MSFASKCASENCRFGSRVQPYTGTDLGLGKGGGERGGGGGGGLSRVNLNRFRAAKARRSDGLFWRPSPVTINRPNEILSVSC